MNAWRDPSSTQKRAGKNLHGNSLENQGKRIGHYTYDNRTVLGSSDVPTSTGNVVRIPRVGGLLNHYERVA
jgi:hypothetical protein